MGIGLESKLALWAVTPNGLALGKKLLMAMPWAILFCSVRMADAIIGDRPRTFSRLKESVAENFHLFDGHIFIMATGIVVRAIAPHLSSKTTDPAVVVIDDQGQFSISLVSGHIGGANRLASLCAGLLDAVPVITTATDIHHKPAIDLLAQEIGAQIENPESIKHVNMALLTGLPVRIYDPWGWLLSRLPEAIPIHDDEWESIDLATSAVVWVEDRTRSLDARILTLRPPSLVVGIGCNRNTPEVEIRELLEDTINRFELSRSSLSLIASINIKSDEPGLVSLAEGMRLPMEFFTKDQLSRVEDAPTPSAVVKQHVGVTSVCEAAAILASQNGPLIVPKQISRNVTVAIARRASTSSELDPEIRPTCPGAHGKY